MFIEDGKGKGTLSEVTSDNRLNVSARQNQRIYYISKDDGKAFVVHFAGEQAVGGTTQGLGYIQYTGNNKLYVNSVSVLTEEDSGETKFGIQTNSTVAAGTTATTTTMNLTSNEVSEVTAKDDNDGTGVTVTGGASVGSVRLENQGTYQIDFDDALILGKNDILAINMNAVTTGTKCRAFIRYFEE